MKKSLVVVLVLTCCLFSSMPAMGLGVKNTQPPEDCFSCKQRNFPVRRRNFLVGQRGLYLLSPGARLNLSERRRGLPQVSPGALYWAHQKGLLENSQTGGRRVVPSPEVTRSNRFRQQHQSWFEHRLNQQGVDGPKRQHFRERFNDHYGY